MNSLSFPGLEDHRVHRNSTQLFVVIHSEQLYRSYNSNRSISLTKTTYRAYFRIAITLFASLSSGWSTPPADTAKSESPGATLLLYNVFDDRCVSVTALSQCGRFLSDAIPGRDCRRNGISRASSLQNVCWPFACLGVCVCMFVQRATRCYHLCVVAGKQTVLNRRH